MGQRRYFASSIYFFVSASFIVAVLVNVAYITLYLSKYQDQDLTVYSSKFYHINNLPEQLLKREPSSKSDRLLAQVLTNAKSNADKISLSSSKDGLTAKGQEEEVWIDIEAQSDRKNVYVAVNNKKVYEINELLEQLRGLHVIVLNQYNGNCMASMIFDFYGGTKNSDLVEFLNSLHPGRVVVCLIKDEGSLGFKKMGRNAVKSFGSKLVHHVGFRDNWAFIGMKGSGWAIENMEKYQGNDVWPSPVKIRASFKLVKQEDDIEKCEYGKNEDEVRRRIFCEKYDGYGDVCKCNSHENLYKKPEKLINNNLDKLPVVIIASRRPRYLLRMLRKLLSVPGADINMITVFIDRPYNETISVAELFGLKFIINEIGCSHNCRIQQHYKKSLSKTFDDFPNAKAAIILEEDLEVSDDFFDYLSQTFPLLESDPSLYCISAWNDQGYKHSVHDPSLLYRVETMPGLGW